MLRFPSVLTANCYAFIHQIFVEHLLLWARVLVLYKKEMTCRQVFTVQCDEGFGKLQAGCSVCP